MAGEQILCRVDGRPVEVGAGGSKKEQLCSRCYQRKRRGVPEDPEPGKSEPGGSVQRSVRLPVMLAATVDVLAAERGEDFSDWVRDAMIARLERNPRQ